MEPVGLLDGLKSIKPDPKDVESLLGLAVFLILTFRNNSAYNRWYEGAIQFNHICGAIGAAGRKVASVMPSESAERALWWLVAALYCAKEQLRSTNQDYALLKRVLLWGQFAELELSGDKCRWAMFRYMCEITKAEVAVDDRSMAKYALWESYKQADPITASFTECVRILNTPMPFAYISHLRNFLIIWLVLLPWIFSPGYGYYSLLLCFFMCYGVLGIEEAVVEVKQPFGRDDNYVPLDQIAEGCFRGLFEFILLVESENEKMADGKDAGAANGPVVKLAPQQVVSDFKQDWEIAVSDD